MKIKFKLYLLIFSKTFPILTFFSSMTYASEVVAPDHFIDFNKDLVFIRKTLLENHPGVCNELDPGFVNEMEKNFKIASEKLFTTDLAEQKAKVIEEFGHSFHDAHLWIRYDLSKTTISSIPHQIGPFRIQKVTTGVLWINVPTFQPSKSEIKNLNQVIKSLPLLREQTIIFDLRDNGGGNSYWGEEILKALFGKEYVNQQLAKSRRNLYTEWRVSEGNLAHIKGLISIIKEQFGENHPANQWIKCIYKGMQTAFLKNKNYYSELPDSNQLPQDSRVINSFNGHIIAVINKNCGSACLDFLDALKAMNASITFVGEPTGTDSVYMELRTSSLPSGKGTLGFPIKVYRNRYRGHHQPHTPDIQYKGDLNHTAELQSFILSQCLNQIK